MPAALRAFFEPRFDASFDEVRLHDGPAAAEAAAEAGARAFALGPHVVFGAGALAPGTAEGRHLIAHELAHVLQQRAAGRAAIQRRCHPPADFDFRSATVGRRLRAAIAAVRQPPAREGGTPRPRIDPGRVLDILASSACFREDAHRVERRYYGRRVPLEFRFHEDPAVGSHFVRGPGTPRVVVEIERAATTATPEPLVRRIVHEIVHATHGPVRARRVARLGPVAGAEAAGVAEEAGTRARENEIMDEIAAAQGWQVTDTPASPADVRASLRSGLPRLTYQEYFIVEAMKESTAVQDFDEAAATAMARQMVRTTAFGRFAAGNLGSFAFGAEAFERRRRLRAWGEPPRVPTLDEAFDCLRQARSRRGRSTLSPLCRAFVDAFGESRRLPSDPMQRRFAMMGFLREYRARRDIRAGAHQEADLFLQWYDALPDNLRRDRRTIDHFRWILIQEAMSRRWLQIGRPDPEVRREHLEAIRQVVPARLLRGLPGPAS